MGKQNKCTAKKKTQHINFCTLIRAPTAGSTAFLSSCSTSVSYPGSRAPLLSRPRSSTCLLPFFTHPGIPIALLAYFMPTSVLESLAVLLLFLVLSSTPPHLVFTTLRTLKQALSDEPLRRLTSSIKTFRPFLPFGSLPNKTNCKRTFDTTFINSRPLANNHA